MAATADTRIERLRAVAAASNLRSPLGRWFAAHHDEFKALLRDYRPRWEALVEQFADDGLLTLPPEFNSDDQKVRKGTRRRVVKSTMRTWERVKVRAAKKPPPPSRAHSPRSTTAESTPPPPVCPPAITAATDDTSKQAAWGESSLIGHTPSAKARPTPEPTPAPKPDLDRLKREMARLLGDRPLPEPDGE